LASSTQFNKYSIIGFEPDRGYDAVGLLQHLAGLILRIDRRMCFEQ
jgi:hypothetical protein